MPDQDIHLNIIGTEWYTVNVKATHEGVIVDVMDENGVVIATAGRTYGEMGQDFILRPDVDKFIDNLSRFGDARATDAVRAERRAVLLRAEQLAHAEQLARATRAAYIGATASVKVGSPANIVRLICPRCKSEHVDPSSDGTYWVCITCEYEWTPKPSTR